MNKHGKKTLFFSKSDVKSAFRLIPVLILHRRWLIMCAEDPESKKMMYFINMCLPFGASISCAIFQAFSDALNHIVKYLLKIDDILTNYLDDFLFIAVMRAECDKMMMTFMRVCKQINCPLSEEKTEWSSLIMTFLGTLLDGRRHCLCIPEDKKIKVLNQIRQIRSKKTATVKSIQQLTGILNFLNRAIVPGRVFTWRMYSRISLKNKQGKKLKQHHHVSLTAKFKKDCEIWESFLNNSNCARFCRPFIDNDVFATSNELNFYTDASGVLGYGCYFNGNWAYRMWPRKFLKICNPSIEYQELFALVAGILTWQRKPQLNNTRVVIFCNNQAVVSMVNNTMSSCHNCMVLLRILVLNNLVHNRRIFVKYVRTTENILADSLSRGCLDVFWKFAPKHTSQTPDEVPRELLQFQQRWIFSKDS